MSREERLTGHSASADFETLADCSNWDNGRSQDISAYNRRSSRSGGGNLDHLDERSAHSEWCSRSNPTARPWKTDECARIWGDGEMGRWEMKDGMGNRLDFAPFATRRIKRMSGLLTHWTIPHQIEGGVDQ